MTLDLNVRPTLRRRLVFLLLISIVLFATALWWNRPNEAGREITYRTANIERGSIIDSVSSTGTISAVGIVELRPQVVGEIIEVTADYNTAVATDQILARLDPETYQQELVQAEANLAIANASLVSSRAAVTRAEADLRNSEASISGLEAQLKNAQTGLDAAVRDLERQQELFSRNVVTAVAVDNAKVRFEQELAQFDQITAQMRAQSATVDSRRAALVQAGAGVVTAEAQVQQREAQLNNAKIRLSHTEITSPVDGIIINRQIELGQTVSTAASADSLFTIAQNLQQMQVEIRVDEADIGNIREGQQVRFGVDAYSGREFTGSVSQMRYAAEIIQNVVTYTVIVAVNNPDLSLLPGMTATARIILEERTEVLRIPNAALRYEPASFANADRGTFAGGGRDLTGDGGRGLTGGGGRGLTGSGGRGLTGGGGQFIAQLMQRYAELELTENQRTQISEEIRATLRREVSSLRNAGQDQVQNRLNELTRAAVTKVLTPQQTERLSALEQQPTIIAAERTQRARSQNDQMQNRRGRSARIFILADDQTPRPIDVQVGITDGGYTELIFGNIELGQTVIIGSNEVVEPEGPTRFGFLRF